MCGLVEAGPTAGGGGRTLQLFCLWQATATTKHVVLCCSSKQSFVVPADEGFLFEIGHDFFAAKALLCSPPQS